MGRKSENHYPAFFNGLNDAFAPFPAGSDIPGSNPATNAVRFEHGAHGVCSRLIFDGMADENVVSHGRPYVNNVSQ